MAPLYSTPLITDACPFWSDHILTHYQSNKCSRTAYTGDCAQLHSFHSIRLYLVYVRDAQPAALLLLLLMMVAVHQPAV
ncbi:hypothetical protein XELAEV_18007310mg [Xenopus laevis]|uniref:Uncharacterized protein n=1 Tax=Xenopus laevis TaxID=8355 RepID=A0A974E0G4_XENLA|nr:hypothetical protein XELAEV_18007310mg [Xenopus laevis]